MVKAIYILYQQFLPGMKIFGFFFSLLVSGDGIWKKAAFGPTKLATAAQIDYNAPRRSQQRLPYSEAAYPCT